VFAPQPEHLIAQLVSIRNQTLSDFTCIVAFDGFPDRHLEERVAEMSFDERFALIRFEQRLGLYRHIERLLYQFGYETEFLAFADQDDVWDIDRLDVQVKTLNSSQAVLVSDNARLVDFELKDLGLSLFDTLRISEESLKFGFMTPFATGAGTIYRASALMRALPFPKNFGSALHDHWLGCIGLATGRCVLNHNPSWSYRQHKANQIGAFRGNIRYRPIRASLSKLTDICFRNDREFEQQVGAYVEELRRRFKSLPSGIQIPTSRNGLRNSLWLLTPRSLSQSRLESLRLFLRQFPGL
jgi:hypothetical protein